MAKLDGDVFRVYNVKQEQTIFLENQVGSELIMVESSDAIDGVTRTVDLKFSSVGSRSESDPEQRLLTREEDKRYWNAIYNYYTTGNSHHLIGSARVIMKRIFGVKEEEDAE